MASTCWRSPSRSASSSRLTLQLTPTLSLSLSLSLSLTLRLTLTLTLTRHHHHVDLHASATHQHLAEHDQQAGLPARHQLPLQPSHGVHPCQKQAGSPGAIPKGPKPVLADAPEAPPSARSCLRLPWPALASQPLAAWSALARHIGLGFDLPRRAPGWSSASSASSASVASSRLALTLTLTLTRTRTLTRTLTLTLTLLLQEHAYQHPHGLAQEPLHFYLAADSKVT